MDDRALRKKEYEDLLNYCKADNRATPTHWGKVTLILGIEKLPRRFYGFYSCLVLGHYHNTSVKQKVERFHKQIRYGAFMTHNNPTHFKKLKDFLMNLKRHEWNYRWFDDFENKSPYPFYPSERLSS
uniref:Uncharacterized protein n=1 Tax=uncultured marine microorganism HF4000_097M14 TaxID=455520 RepID=B3T1V6_9ZZZZ|nr:hypothetical protein ALOHA_HF4000097M14ctg1g8 [uncultured marine microorganism HF4000_097M14]